MNANPTTICFPMFQNLNLAHCGLIRNRSSVWSSLPRFNFLETVDAVHASLRTPLPTTYVACLLDDAPRLHIEVRGLKACCLGALYRFDHQSKGPGGLRLSKSEQTAIPQAVSIVFFTDTWRPDSFYDRIAANRKLGLHTLCLLDIKVKEPSLEALARGRTVYEAPRCAPGLSRTRESTGAAEYSGINNERCQ